jgi:hypothetical protein
MRLYKTHSSEAGHATMRLALNVVAGLCTRLGL